MSCIKVMSKKNSHFPLIIKHRNATVTIYKIKRKDTSTGFIYSVSWIDANRKRIQKQLVKLADAKALAREKAEFLSSGKQEAADMDRSQLEELVFAKRITKDIPLLSAIQEWKKAYDMTGGNIIPAAQAWQDMNNTKVKKLKVGEAVKMFMEAKLKEGREVKTSYRLTLPRFSTDFEGSYLSRISTLQLQEWLNRNFNHPATRNSHRKRLVTFFRYMRAQGFLPRNAQTEAELTSRAKEDALDIGITDAVTYRKLLKLIQDRHPHYLAALVLAGLCGMRRNEIHNQNWKDISLDRKFVRVSAAKPGTPAKRLVTLCDTAIEWLMLCPSRTGEVCPGTTLVMDRIRFIGKKNGLDLPANCFRHSCISCRVAATGEIDRTALEAGTSAKMIHKHYRELVTPEEGAEWFEVGPSDEDGKVVSFENVGN